MSPMEPIEADVRSLAGLHDNLRRKAERDEFSGVALVVRDGQPILQKAYGYASRGFRVPSTLETRFDLRSISKCFTTVAVLQLVEQGSIALTDTAGQLLPEWTHDASDRITVHQLLTHTSGLPALTNDDWRRTQRTVQSLTEMLRERPQQFEPGARVAYSVAGYVLLARIIERASGLDYFTHMQRHVFGPAGMTSTDFPELDLDPPGIAVGYAHADENWNPDPNAPLRMLPGMAGWRGMASNGAYSTAGDLWRFTQALLGHRLLNAELTRLALQGKVDFPLPPLWTEGRYGYGFIERWRGPRRWRSVGHTGGTGGASNELAIFPDQGLTVIVLGNYDTSGAWDVVDRAVHALSAD